jgi:glycosyltransferase involved in cell wall biosynthesis
MHILIVSQYFWPENFRVNDLAVGLIERGHKVTVLTGIPNYPAGRFFKGYGLFKTDRDEYKGIRILRAPLVSRGSGKGIRLALNYVSFIITASIVGFFRCREKYDLIFVCQLSPVTVGLPALLLKKARKIPILFWVLDLWPESLSATGAIGSSWFLSQVDKLVSFIYNRCDKIVVASKGYLTSVTEKGISVDRTGYLPNWYEPEYFGRNKLKDDPKIGKLPEGFCVMFAGNIGVAQDFETILKAVAILRPYQDIYWVIVGDGRRYEWVRKQVALQGLEDTVHLLGRHPPERMYAFFAQADTMLVTLKADPAFGLTVPGKIQSYMACGRPIVASLDGEGAKLISESGAGLVSAAEDAEGLANSVKTLFRMPKRERERMGLRGKEYCNQNFDREILIDRVVKWMRDLT